MIPLKLLFRLFVRLLKLPIGISSILARLFVFLGALAAIFQLIIELYRRFPRFRRVVDRLLDAWTAKPPELGGRREVHFEESSEEL